MTEFEKWIQVIEKGGIAVFAFALLWILREVGLGRQERDAAREEVVREAITEMTRLTETMRQVQAILLRAAIARSEDFERSDS